MSDLFDRVAMAAIGSPSAVRTRRRSRFEPLPEIADAIAPAPRNEARADGIVAAARSVVSGFGSAAADGSEMAEQSRGMAGGPIGTSVTPDGGAARAVAPEPRSDARHDRADNLERAFADLRGARSPGASRASDEPQSLREAAAPQADAAVTTSRQRDLRPDGVMRSDRDPAPAPTALVATAMQPAPVGDRSVADDRATDQPLSLSTVRVAAGDGHATVHPARQTDGREAASGSLDLAGEPRVPAIAAGGKGLLAAPVRSADPLAWPGDRADRQHPAPVATVRQPRQGISPGTAPSPATVEVTIGRLEIRAAAPATPGERPKRAFAPHLDLEAYRARRDRRE